MKLRLERIDPTPSPDRVFLFVYLLWAGLILTIHLVNRLTGQEFIVCFLRRFAGVPCPTCGSTRAVEAALSGRFLAALHYNPLVIALLIVGAALLSLRLVAKRRLILGLSTPERLVAWTLAILLVALNWWHVIGYHTAA